MIIYSTTLFLLAVSLILVSFIIAVLLLNRFRSLENARDLCSVRGVNSHCCASRVHFNDGPWISCSGREARHCVTVCSHRGTRSYGHVVFWQNKYAHKKHHHHRIVASWMHPGADVPKDGCMLPYRTRAHHRWDRQTHEGGVHSVGTANDGLI